MKEAGRFDMGRLPKVVTFFSAVYYDKVIKKFAIFYKLFALLFYYVPTVWAQPAGNEVTIELGPSTFPIERPYIISVILSNSDSRPTITFPDVPGFAKKGISRSVTPSEVAGKTVVSQIISQSYQARAPGRFRLPPFTITVDDDVARSEGAMLVVQAPIASAPSTLTTVASAPAVPGNELAFLTLQASKPVIYSGEGVALTLSFFVADNYPYVLNFQSLDQQLQAITKKIRPANTWEENLNITELKPVPILIKGKKFRQFRLYQSIFFPLSNQRLQLPAVSLWLSRKPVVGPPQSQDDKIVFTTLSSTITVRPLPPHPRRGQVPVGTFRLEEGLEREQVSLGKSVRYTITIAGEGNIAALPAPARLNESADMDIFPPEEKQSLMRSSDRVMGRKTFTYFIVPHQNGLVTLADQFQWIYFDLKTARYDTLHPNLQLQIGGRPPAATESTTSDKAHTISEEAPAVTVGNSLYAGLEAMDSAQQRLSLPVLIRALANVLIVLMLLGIIFVIFKK